MKIQFRFNIILLLLFWFNITVKSQVKIQMIEQNGVFYIPCKINGLQSNFIFDTGASDVSLSKNFAEELISNGLITQEDITGSSYYSIADGNLVEGITINIKKIEIGGITIENIKGSIINSEANVPLLLGQSAISKLSDIISIDYLNSQLVLGNSYNRIEQTSAWQGNVKENLIKAHKQTLSQVLKIANDGGFRDSEKENMINPIKRLIEDVKKSTIYEINLSDIIMSADTGLPINILKAKSINYSIKIKLDIKTPALKNYRLKIESTKGNSGEIGVVISEDLEKIGYMAVHFKIDDNTQIDEKIYTIKGINILKK